ncbi:MAG: hypothetical protein QN163_05890 [Armatimonadota bacterium]|nr:hypothetical protein [Armatimonadota bacterium]MDR5697244.1 hypothetical protein [Armatimonadota bacterium]
MRNGAAWIVVVVALFYPAPGVSGAGRTQTVGITVLPRIQVTLLSAPQHLSIPARRCGSLVTTVHVRSNVTYELTVRLRTGGPGLSWQVGGSPLAGNFVTVASGQGRTTGRTHDVVVRACIAADLALRQTTAELEYVARGDAVVSEAARQLLVILVM